MELRISRSSICCRPGRMPMAAECCDDRISRALLRHPSSPAKMLAACVLDAGLHTFRRHETYQSSGTSSKATMLMILINGLIAGPAVSL